MAIDRLKQREANILAAEKLAAAELKTYDGITNRVISTARLTRVAFEKMAPEQRVYLIHKYLGSAAAEIYEREIPNQVVVLNAAVSQGAFSRTFTNINEATSIYANTSSDLNNTLYGLYNSSTKYFILLETYRALMSSIGSINKADSVLSDITIPETSVSVAVPSLGSFRATVTPAEIRSILSNRSSSIIGTITATETILTEALVLALLDLGKVTESIGIIDNFTTPPAYSNIGENLTKLDTFILEEGWSFSEKTLSSDLTSSSTAVLPLTGNVVSSSSQRVSFEVTEYTSGSLTLFLQGKVIFNENLYKGKVSIDVVPGTSDYSDLVFLSSDLKATINDIEIRKIT
jgi:hypothetical protein